jgi:hypothetical protein
MSASSTPLTPELFKRYRLYCEISVPVFQPFLIISHPLVANAVVWDWEDKTHSKPPIMLTANDENFHRILDKQLDWLSTHCKTVEALLMVYTNKPYRVDMLDWLGSDLSVKTYSELLADTWTDVEFPHQNGVRKLVAMFKRANPAYLMTKKEKAILHKLPDPIEVFRGLQGGKARIRALSWTTDYDKARWFACRFHQKAPVVYQAEIRKEGVFAYFEGRGESEVVVNPSKLLNVRRVK